MRFSKTFTLYIITRLLVNIGYFFLIFSLIGFIIDFLETIRESQGKVISLAQIFELVIHKVPFLTQSFLPFIILFGSILTFTKLNNNFELAAAKSAGLSIWSLCIPISITMLTFSIFMFSVFQPISAVLLEKNRVLGIKYLGYQAKMVSLQSNGIWLYDQEKDLSNDKIVNIKNLFNQADKGTKFLGVTIYLSGSLNDFTTSYIAKEAELTDNKITLYDVKRYVPGKKVENFNEISMPIKLSHDQIQERIPNPDIIPFWHLKNFISKIKKAGLSTLKHELYYQSTLCSPLLYISLVFIALACSINLPRNGKLGIVFVTGGVLGISIFFINKVSSVMALTGTLPLTLAIIAPSICYILLSIAILIHCEES